MLHVEGAIGVFGPTLRGVCAVVSVSSPIREAFFLAAVCVFQVPAQLLKAGQAAPLHHCSPDPISLTEMVGIVDGAADFLEGPRTVSAVHYVVDSYGPSGETDHTCNKCHNHPAD